MQPPTFTAPHPQISLLYTTVYALYKNTYLMLTFSLLVIFRLPWQPTWAIWAMVNFSEASFTPLARIIITRRCSLLLRRNYLSFSSAGAQTGHAHFEPPSHILGVSNKAHLDSTLSPARMFLSRYAAFLAWLLDNTKTNKITLVFLVKLQFRRLRLYFV